MEYNLHDLREKFENRYRRISLHAYWSLMTNEASLGKLFFKLVISTHLKEVMLRYIWKRVGDVWKNIYITLFTVLCVKCVLSDEILYVLLYKNITNVSENIYAWQKLT